MARKKTITSREASRILGITVTGLLKIVERGELSRPRRQKRPNNIGFAYQFDRREVERLAVARRENPPKTGPKPKNLSP